ncbi:glycosyltransferase [Flavobacterium sp. Sd200]|uniref:glycosyltransferase family 2 protein n=1 Tax=Flavobacterium sp. Sd200 TaxID=2692211 RepID=UPI00136A130F|nr:glycosyltransferase family 2 protein [Flavobacterium sp. Sd200]MXN91977.1 glycosyltransferase [Flavobacterium sp. Sd200]
MLNITTIILTYNEEKHIERCIINAKKFSNQIFLVDSFSSDNTKQIAESLGAIVYQNKWENNHSKQFNWGLNNLPITNEWVFRLDADEYLSDSLINELHSKVKDISAAVSGVIFERKMYFLDKLITKGMPKMNILRMFRCGKAVCEDRWMDEHIVVTEGETTHFEHYFVDHNLNSLGWWIDKHNNYSIREAIELLDVEYDFLEKNDSAAKFEVTDEAKYKRDKKLKYAKMKLFWRSFVYFVYRYIFKFGFTEGKEGFLWHFLQGWWYRTLVDAKIYEIKKACGDDKEKIKKYIQNVYKIAV